MRPPPAPDTDQSRLLRRLLSLSAQYRSDCIQVFAFQVILLVLGVSGLGLSGLAIDVTRHALDPSAPPPRWPLGFTPSSEPAPGHALLVIGGLVLLMAASRALLNYSYSVAVGRLIHLKLVPELRTSVFDKLQRLSFRFFDENASGSIINRVTSDVQSVRSFVDGVLLQGGIMLLSLSVYMVYMLRTHVGLTLACLSLTPLIWLLTARFSRWARPAYKRNRELADEMVLAMSEGIHGIQVTKVFGREEEELSRFRERNHAVLEQQQEIFRRVSRFGPTVQFITHLNVAVLLVYGSYLVIAGSLTIGDLVVFAGLLQQFSGQISSMAGIINTLQQSLTGARRVFEVLDAPLEVASPARPREIATLRGHVRFEHVSFAYEAGDEVLRDIDFEVAPGRCVAILGLTGAGKSTLLSLIPRFYDASRGRVLVDDVDVKEMELDTLRKNIGLVFQESLLFRNTVAQNIAFGHPGASRDAIERAARTAGADEFIRELPQGYDTVLEEAAVNLSGGQRQRIAIARALLLEPRILLLDDPTTAIDPETEAEVLSAMDSAMNGRTTLVIANRLSTLRRADEILVLSDGRIVERGTHAQLMAEHGIYFRAASLQAADNESQQLLDALEARA
ncbi:MAG: ABC transporter ATP-binding protein [Polyangiaceae bacterium]